MDPQVIQSEKQHQDPKVIQSEKQHQDYLREIEHLLEQAPPVGSRDADRLNLLTVLVEAYESKKFPIEAPDPIDAIQFRMQEQGLTQSDLAPYFGTRSRVSEVLARKRPLTVQMIRAVSVGLGISADTLIGLSSTQKSGGSENVDWSKFPLREMISRGWIEKASGTALKSADEMVKNFVQGVGLTLGAVSFRRSILGDAYSPTTKYALYAWLARVIQRSRQKSLRTFDPTVLSHSFFKELAQLSWFDNGPQLAVEFLEKHGIAVVFEAHLKGTVLDGAAFKDDGGRPVIGMTLRFNRLDNFWFTLLHEVAHIWKHTSGSETFLDNSEIASEDSKEVEANRIAREAFIPRAIWKRCEAYTNPSAQSIDKLSRELKIHPAVIAGRIRRETGNYGSFADMVGQDEVRKFFDKELNAEGV